MKLLEDAIKLTMYFVSIFIITIIAKTQPEYKEYIVTFMSILFLLGLAFVIDMIVSLYKYIVKKIEKRENDDI